MRTKGFHATFKKSLPFALVILLMSLYTRMDVIMIENMLEDGKYQAGVYGAGYRLLDASNMIGYLLHPYCFQCFQEC
ncbi:MAG: hypothetical protein R2769_13570 [Saprospiraceae bacterium]